MTNVEPVAENVPPAATEPVSKAPVENVTEPSEWPAGAVIPLKEWSCDPIELMPAAETEIDPNSFVRLIPSAQAASGNANASSAKTMTRLIF